MHQTTDNHSDADLHFLTDHSHLGKSGDKLCQYIMHISNQDRTALQQRMLTNLAPFP